MSFLQSFKTGAWMLCALACTGCSDDASTLPAPIEREAVGTRHPPPISGGTLAVSRDGALAFAADPDFDRVYIASLVGDPNVRQVALRSGDEPGRVVEDGAGRVHVVLRRAGEVVTIDPASASVTARRAVCPAPRGIAWSEQDDSLYVACAGGELVTLPAAGGAATRSLRLDRDLRDVVPVGSELWVSRFRSAEVLVVNEAGEITRRMRPQWGAAGTEPAVAWRMIPYGDGAAMVHQRAGVPPASSSASPSGTPMYYVPATASCSFGMTPTQVTVFMPDVAPLTSPPVNYAVLPVDLAGRPMKRAGLDSGRLVIAAPGNSESREQLIELFPFELSSSATCIGQRDVQNTTRSRVVAVWGLSNGAFVAQTREPASLYLSETNRVIPLTASERRNDLGHELFHTATTLRVACASCHPEGADDGHTWLFTGEGLRRTPDLRGGILTTAPYHWSGGLATMDALMDEVMVRRMGHPAVGHSEVAAVAHWLDGLPLPARSSSNSSEAVARGAEVFRRADVGCVTCHAGPRGTNNQSVNVGTGAAFQVPSLDGLAGRASYMHDGCAATLRDRFGPCGGGEAHGHVAQLGAGELDDLIAYLETL